MTKLYKTKINRRLAKIIESMGLRLEFSEEYPEKGNPNAQKALACFWAAESMIWVKKTTPYESHVMNCIISHEIGHACSYILGGSNDDEYEEVRANGFMYAFAYMMKIPVDERMFPEILDEKVRKVFDNRRAGKDQKMIPPGDIEFF